MKPINSILVFSDIRDYYFTDGINVYHEVQKEQNALHYRVKNNGKSIKITEDNCEEVNKLVGRKYLFDNGKLYRQNKWQVDFNGYNFIITDPRGARKKISQHRLVYFYNNNIVPPEGYVIDHIDRNRQNNTLNNLRLVPPKVNSNNTDMKQKKYNHSKYIYSCLDLSTGEQICVGLADQIHECTGIDTKNLNRYAKYGYIYKNAYKFFIVDSKEEFYGTRGI